MSIEAFKNYIEATLKGLVSSPETLKVDVSEFYRNFIVTVYLEEEDIRHLMGRHRRTLSALERVFQVASGSILNTPKRVTLEYYANNSEQV